MTMTNTTPTASEARLEVLYSIAKIESLPQSDIIREACGEIMGALDSLFALAGGERPPVIIVRDKAGTITGLRCPRCLALHGTDGDEEGSEVIQEVDVAERWNWMSADAEGGTFYVSWDGSGDYEHDGFRCDSCGARLTGTDDLKLEGS